MPERVAPTDVDVTPPDDQGTRWDLTRLFVDDAEAVRGAEASADAAEALAREAGALLKEGALSAFLERLGSIGAALDELDAYAQMRQYVDAADADVQALVGVVQAALNRGRAGLERALEAWRALPEATAAALLSDDAVAAGAYRLGRARELARHRLSPEIERAWTARATTARDRWTSLQELAEARTTVPFDDGTGERPWGLGDVWTEGRSPDAAVRARAHDALATGYGEILDVISLAWDAVVHDRLVEDRLRGRAHPAQETLDDEDLPLEGLLELVDAVSARTDLQQTLLRAQAALTGSETLTAADLVAQLPGLPELGHARVVELALTGLASLHPLLRRDGEELYAAHRIDAAPQPGKQMYAATWETRLDPPAYVAFRYTGRPSNVGLLGHELGHAIGLARAAAVQPVIARGWPGGLFEVPSNVAELAASRALHDALPEHAAGLRLLEAQDLVWSVFHAIAFCRVELDLYAMRAEGTPLGADLLTRVFRERFGEVLEPAVAVGEREALVLLGSRCGYAVGARFYSYQYAVGALVALALHALRDEDPDGFGERYVAFLGVGRSAAPAEQLRAFGLDLRRATWERGLAELERRVGALASDAGLSPSAG